MKERGDKGEPERKAARGLQSNRKQGRKGDMTAGRREGGKLERVEREQGKE